jgi:hypothetical protein
MGSSNDSMPVSPLGMLCNGEFMSSIFADNLARYFERSVEIFHD